MKISKNKYENGFTIVEHVFYDIILSLDLKLNELKILCFIYRLTVGTHSDWVKLRNVGLEAINISPNTARDRYLIPLIKKRLIRTKHKNYYQINMETFREIYTKDNNLPSKRYRALIGKSIREGYQNDKKEYNKKVGKAVSKRKVKPYQNDRSGSKGTAEEEGLESSKYNLNKTINKTVKDMSAYKPKTKEEYIAYEIWKGLEPNNDRSFPFYIYAASELGELLFDFKSEILQDSSIENKGAVFVKKVKDKIEGLKGSK